MWLGIFGLAAFVVIGSVAAAQLAAERDGMLRWFSSRKPSFPDRKHPELPTPPTAVEPSRPATDKPEPPDSEIISAAGTYTLAEGLVVEIRPYRGLVPVLNVSRDGRRARNLGASLATAPRGGFATTFVDHYGIRVDVYVGTHNAESIYCAPGADHCVILGLGGDDALIGSKGRDVLIGGAGRDQYIGNGGDDDIRRDEQDEPEVE